MDFGAADLLFRNEQISELGANPAGRRYLKLRSLSRGEYLARLLDQEGFESARFRSREMFEVAFNANICESKINSFIRAVYLEERTLRLAKEATLVSELYKLEVFDWGGLHQNSLEKTIVDNYIKKINRYDKLEEAIDGELHSSMRGYVLCSWYNHWTSILIEDVFRDHEKVLPAIGQVKKIDFFVNNVPFDLKVTYLPEGFVAGKRKAVELRPELTLLKACARNFRLPFETDIPNARLMEDLWKKISDHPDETCRQLISDIKSFRRTLVSELTADPTELIIWLYENQGIRRFDASNRLFLILVDTSDYFGSWKLKRALPLLQKGISSYLDSVPQNPGHNIPFNWEGKSYRVRSDVVLVSK